MSALRRVAAVMSVSAEHNAEIGITEFEIRDPDATDKKRP